MKSPRSYGKPPQTAETIGTIVTHKMTVRNEHMREAANLRQENKLLKAKLLSREEEINNLRHQMRDLFVQNESAIVAKSFGAKTERQEINASSGRTPNTPRGIIDTSVMMASNQLSQLTNRDKQNGKITIRGEASF